MDMSTNDFILPMKEGIEKPKGLEPISRVVNFVKAVIVSGIGPINLLKARVKSTSESIFPNEVGISELSEFSSKYKF